MKKIKAYLFGLHSRMQWLVAILMVGGGTMPLGALADSGGLGIQTAPTNIINNASDVVNIFCTSLDWLFWLLIVLTTAMVLVAGYMYATAGGDAEKVSKATKALTYAAVAVVVALFAKGFPSIIGSFFSTSVSACQ